MQAFFVILFLRRTFTCAILFNSLGAAFVTSSIIVTVIFMLFPVHIITVRTVKGMFQTAPSFVSTWIMLVALRTADVAEIGIHFENVLFIIIGTTYRTMKRMIKNANFVQHPFVMVTRRIANVTIFVFVITINMITPLIRATLTVEFVRKVRCICKVFYPTEIMLMIVFFALRTSSDFIIPVVVTIIYYCSTLALIKMLIEQSVRIRNDIAIRLVFVILYSAHRAD